MHERGHSGRRYVVTGGASGIGRAVSEVLIRDGAYVAVADRDVDAAQQVADTLGERCLAVRLDVSSRSSWDEASRQVRDELGGVDGLVNNAGITRDRTMKRMSDDEWQQVIDVHLRGTWLGCQILADDLGASSTGSIVNISSSGRHGSYGQTNYAAAKAGIVGLTKSVALELAKHGVRCNAVAPGAVETPMLADVPETVKQGWMDATALGRLAQPEEIAEAVAFLLSPASSYVTAHVLDVNGGEMHL
ncbi:SDR family oxidoreductase [Aeromicrobium sp. UC242_57]|uniref:SDR family oxidoreductase n=1 Tax=Aeromicrobium sp. UC242_57 TaxID=3374624 RepID=UPI0037BB688C